MNNMQRIRIGLLTAKLKLENIFTTDREYKRDEKGRFAKTGTTARKGTRKKYSKGRPATVKVSPGERRMVERELNTHLTKAQRKKFIVRKAIRNHLYTVENYGFDNYRIIDKMELE